MARLTHARKPSTTSICRPREPERASTWCGHERAVSARAALRLRLARVVLRAFDAPLQQIDLPLLSLNRGHRHA